MRTIRRWLPLLLVGLPLLGVAAFGGALWSRITWKRTTRFARLAICTKKITEFHPVQDKRVTLAAAHNLEGEKNVKCIDCHIGATVKDKMVIKALAARDTWRIWARSRNPPTCATPSAPVRASSVIPPVVRT